MNKLALSLIFTFGTTVAYAGSSNSDKDIWDALNVEVEQLPTLPGYSIGEAKRVGRLSCSHIKQDGYAEVFTCSLKEFAGH
ncbi:MAG TPA: hypothetical protein VIG33_13190 [Pseudobdellovibrionaceae bacterium]|jgi:hypothetical protein